jgi:hypothetical protein
MAWTFYNSTGEALTNFGPVALTDLDIDGGNDIGAAIVDADLFIVDDGAGGTNRKTAASRIKTYVGAVPAQANQAALEAETNEDTYAAPDMIKYSPGVAKAYCTTAGNGTLGSGDYNVASVTVNATGDGTIIWDTDFADALYVVGGMLQDDASNTNCISYSTPAVGSVRRFIRDSDTGDLYGNVATIVAFGDQ